MNTFWLKIAALAVVVVGLIILVSVFSGSGEPKPKPKTFYDVIEQDDRRLRAEPEPEVEQTPTVKKINKSEPDKPKPKPQFKELTPEDQMQAEKLFEMALTHRKMGRLPGMTFKKMVDYCRQIIERWPDSVYAFKARRMLRDIPQRHRELYKITDEEMGL